MDEYHVKITPRAAGGYMVSVSGPRIILVDTEFVESVEEAKEWAAQRVEWHRTKEDAVEYDL